MAFFWGEALESRGSDEKRGLVSCRLLSGISGRPGSLKQSAPGAAQPRRLLSFGPPQRPWEPPELLSLPASLSLGLFSGASGRQMRSPGLACELAAPATYSVLQLNPRSNISLTTLSGQWLIMAYI